MTLIRSEERAFSTLDAVRRYAREQQLDPEAAEMVEKLVVALFAKLTTRGW